jgi:hypothetical protein
MSQAYARKYEFKICEMKYAYRISSAGADTLTNQMVLGVTLGLENRDYQLNLVLMPGLGVNVILGMNWMKQWEVVKDTTKRVVSLKEHVKAGTFLVPLPSRIDLQSMSCATKVTSIQDVLVVCEFPDVFPDELPGLPLDRYIEFAI